MRCSRHWAAFLLVILLAISLTLVGRGLGEGRGDRWGIRSQGSQAASHFTLYFQGKHATPEKGFKRQVKPQYVPGEVLVKLKSALSTHCPADVLQKAAGAGLASSVRRSYPSIGVHLLRISEPGVSVAEAIKRLKAHREFEYAEPNYILRAAATPNDPDFDALWGLNNTGQSGGTTDADLDAPEAWDLTTGSGNTIIAVIDSGVAYNHSDLLGNIWINTVEQNGSLGVDDDGNGYVDDIYGWDFVDDDGYPTDYNSHGTHVAGTIAARGNNATGITGVMWRAEIIPIRFLGVEGSGDTAAAAAAIIYAADQGARIMNASWGGYGYSQTLYDAIDYARGKDVLFVAAAGNENNDDDANPFYPAGYNLPNIIAVAATDANDDLANFSNYGERSVDLGAPGVSIHSSVPLFAHDPPITVYSQDFDGGVGSLPLLGWGRGGTHSTWAVTAGTGVGGTHSIEDSPSGNYQNDTRSWAGYMTPIPSVKNNRYTLSFKWKGRLETFYDTLDIDYSPDGANWDWIDYRTGGTGGSFVDDSVQMTEVTDLLDSFYFGFAIDSDSSLTYDGAYIDEVVLSREPILISGYSYTDFNGTSMAAPHVSGVAGLILSINPALTHSQVKDIILGNVDLRPSLSGRTSTGGRLNAFAAVNGAGLSFPSSLVASAKSSSRIGLAWVDNSSSETGFAIERKTGSSGTYAQIATVTSNTTRYDDGDLHSSTKYCYRVRAYSAGGNSAYSNEASAMTSHSGDGGGGGGGSGGGSGCFVATAAYGSYFASEVQVLRKFRDECLMPSLVGRKLVRFYYRTSPAVADWISHHEGLRALTRYALTPVVFGIKHPSTLSFLVGVLVLVAFKGFLLNKVKGNKPSRKTMRGIREIM